MKKFLLLLSIITLAACESNEEQVADEFDKASLPNVNGTFLAAVKPVTNSIVSFWELEPGLLFISVNVESSEDLAKIDVKKTINAERSVVDIYKDFAGNNINATYLKTLQEAQVRRENADAADSDEITAEALLEANRKLEQESSRTMLIPRTNCQPDHYGDAYGDRWFVSNYGPLTNGGLNEYEYSKIVNTKKVRFAGMAADFAATAVFRTYRMNSNLTQWIMDSDVTLQPRTITWTAYLSESKKWYRFEVLGHAPCPRVHALYQIL